MFDYGLLNGSATKVKDAAELIRRSSQSIAEEAIYIGEKLIEVKSILPHGMFGQWIKHEFGWSERTARNYMAIATRFGKTAPDADLSLSVMTVLAGDDVPESAVEEVVALASSGEKVTKAKAEEVKKKHTTRKPKNRIATQIEQVYGPEPEVVQEAAVSVEPVVELKIEPAPVFVEQSAPIEPLTDKQKLAKIMELVASLESPDSQYEVVTQTVAMLHPEDRCQLFSKLNEAFPPSEEKHPELFAGDPADLVPPKKINTPELRKAWLRWCDSNKTKGKPLTVDEAMAQLKMLAAGKSDTAVRRIEHALAMRMDRLPLAKELPNDFEPPTQEEVVGYATAMKLLETDAIEFFGYYASQGWKKANGLLVEDWKQSLHNWVKNNPQKPTPDKDPKYANGAYDPRSKSGRFKVNQVFTG